MWGSLIVTRGERYRDSLLETAQEVVPIVANRGQIIVVGTGFWTFILSPVFWAGLSQITRFWTNRIPAAVPVIKSRVND